ncbi:MAG: putative ABC transporter ATP-binding protein YknY [Phycisphaerae bacterium]|nr:putative ABC transporter ATP-binding protein YknY [Phycisphaerae bacterium]
MISSPDIVAQLQTLTKVYRQQTSAIEVQALRGVDLTFRRGEYIAICGASGSGKSTLLNILGCLDRPTSGQYLLGGADVSLKNDDELSDIRSEFLGFVFQSFNLIPQLTVQENVEVPLFYRNEPAEERARMAKIMLEMVGLSDRGHHRPNELSGGQMQRVAIARALVNDPLLILADEPTGNLDTRTGEMILDVFDRLNKQEQRTIIMVTHEPDVAARCSRTIHLRDGLILSDDPNPPYVRAAPAQN